MNLLAHALLTPKRGDIRMGNFLADFLTPSEIRDQSSDFQRGTKYHYEVDRVTDEYAAPFVPLLQPAVGKFSAAVLDVFWDHFLTLEWSKYSEAEPLTPFIARVYSEVHQFALLMPEEKSLPLRHMQQKDWLACYGTWDGLESTLNRMSRRVFFRTGRPIELSPALDALKEHYSQLETVFPELWTKLIAIKRPK